MIQITKHKNAVYCNTEKNIIELIILILIFISQNVVCICKCITLCLNAVKIHEQYILHANNNNGNNTQQDILPNTWILFLQRQAEN